MDIFEDLLDLAHELDKNEAHRLADSVTYLMKVASERKDHEVSMAKNDLSTAMRAIEDLMKNLPEEETDLPHPKFVSRNNVLYSQSQVIFSITQSLVARTISVSSALLLLGPSQAI